jgi:hypothetical protein
LWRRAFDAVEKQAAPPLEGAVRTGAFADAASLAIKLQSRVRRTVTNRTAQLLHLVNLPAASDITRLREQVALLDHELRQLRRGVEDAAQPAAASRTRTTRAAARPRADSLKPNRHKEKHETTDTPATPATADPTDTPATPATADPTDTPATPATADSDNSRREGRNARAAQSRPTRSR